MCRVLGFKGGRHSGVVARAAYASVRWAALGAGAGHWHEVVLLLSNLATFGHHRSILVGAPGRGQCNTHAIQAVYY